MTIDGQLVSFVRSGGYRDNEGNLTLASVNKGVDAFMADNNIQGVSHNTLFSQTVSSLGSNEVKYDKTSQGVYSNVTANGITANVQQDANRGLTTLGGENHKDDQSTSWGFFGFSVMA